MKLIKGGKKIIGSDQPIIPGDGEGPARWVELDDFWLDQNEVSNLQFARFVEETGYVTEAEKFGNSFVIEMFISEKTQASINKAVARAPWWLPVEGADWKHPTGPDSNISSIMDHPVVHVSWNDAWEFCNHSKKSLPTEAQWEIACRSGKKNRLFPWGNKEEPKGKVMMNTWQGDFPTGNSQQDGFAATCPVWFYGNQTEEGLNNMVGNVWEWVSDWWEVRHTLFSAKNPQGPGKGKEKVKKGGSFACIKTHCYRQRCGSRSQNTPDSSAYNLGFRCASNHYHNKYNNNNNNNNNNINNNNNNNNNINNNNNNNNINNNINNHNNNNNKKNENEL